MALYSQAQSFLINSGYEAQNYTNSLHKYFKHLPVDGDGSTDITVLMQDTEDDSFQVYLHLCHRSVGVVTERLTNIEIFKSLETFVASINYVKWEHYENNYRFKCPSRTLFQVSLT